MSLLPREWVAGSDATPQCASIPCRRGSAIFWRAAGLRRRASKSLFAEHARYRAPDGFESRYACARQQRLLADHHRPLLELRQRAVLAASGETPEPNGFVFGAADQQALHVVGSACCDGARFHVTVQTVERPRCRIRSAVVRPSSSAESCRHRLIEKSLRSKSTLRSKASARRIFSMGTSGADLVGADMERKAADLAVSPAICVTPSASWNTPFG